MHMDTLSHFEIIQGNQDLAITFSEEQLLTPLPFQYLHSGTLDYTHPQHWYITLRFDLPEAGIQTSIIQLHLDAGSTPPPFHRASSLCLGILNAEGITASCDLLL